MKVYALRCVEGSNDPKIVWEKGTYPSHFASGNPTPNFEEAEIFTTEESVLRRKDLYSQLGCKFELLTFELISVEK